ncbi:MAG: hypothetical protein ABI456_13995 [Ktedonobacteraceae bacterium]|nr:hypothetical protein [Chloroflexota bacterium]
MTQNQDVAIPYLCPRCGGRLYKPTGSSFYWHADNNHPRCDITNIAESLLAMQKPVAVPPHEPPLPPKSKRSRK